MNINNEIKINKKMTQFVVIGLGRFGRSVATTLASLGNEVLAIDTNSALVKKIEPYVSSAVVADTTQFDILHSLGVQNFDCVVICIGDDLQASILTTLNCKDLNVDYIVAKAQTDQHKKVLERIGANMVVFPENYMGKKVASMLDNPSINEILNLTDSYKIVEIATPDKWINKSIGELNIRNKYNVSIIFIRRGEEVVTPNAETIFNLGDILIVAGEVSKLENLSNKASEVIDANHSLQDALEE